MIFDWLKKRKILSLIRAINDTNTCICTTFINPKLNDYLQAYRDNLCNDLVNQLTDTFAWFEEELEEGDPDEESTK